MAQRNILLRLTGDGESAKRTLSEVADDIRKFGRERATADVRVDGEQAKRDIAEVLAELKALPRSETIKLKVNAEEAKLASLLDRLERLQGVQASGGGSDALTQRIGSVARQIDTSRSKLEDLHHELDRVGSDGESAFRRVGSSIGSLRTGIAGLNLGQLFTGALKGVSDLASKLPIVGELFGSMAESGLGLAAVLPVLAAIVAGVVLLAGSLALALGGVVALGVAFLAALGPIVLLGGLVFEAISKMVSGAQQQRQAAEQLKQALYSQRQAVIALHQAQQDESTQRVAALQAEKQAQQALKDAINATADARLGVDSAKLQQQQAELTLKEFRRSLAALGETPGSLFKKSQTVDVTGAAGQTQTGSDPLATQKAALQYKQDLLAVKQAKQGVTDATQRLVDAQAQEAQAQAVAARYMTEGLRAFPSYLSAVRQVASAERSLAHATAATALARQNYRRASTNVPGSSASALAPLIGAWHELKAAIGEVFGPAERAVFQGIAQAIGIIARGMLPLRGSFTDLGREMGAAFVQIARALTSKTAITFFRQLTTDSVRFIRTGLPGFIAFGKLLLEIARAAMPTLLSGLAHLSGTLGKTANNTRGVHGLIVDMVRNTVEWWHGIQAAFRAFESVYAGAKKLRPLFVLIWGALKLIALALEGWERLIGVAVSGWRKIYQWVNSVIPLGRVMQSVFGGVVHVVQSIAGWFANALGNARALAQLKQLTAANARDRAALLAKDRALLASPRTSSHMRQFLLEQLKSLGLAHAAGGVTTGPSMGLIGESGAEAVLPLTSGRAMQAIAHALLGPLVGALPRYLSGLADRARAHLPDRTGAPSLASARELHLHAEFRDGGYVADPDHFFAQLERRYLAWGSSR